MLHLKVKHLAKKLSTIFATIQQVLKSFSKNLYQILIKRIVFLFDEAAHVFSHTQQEKFFSFFKGLRDPKIACKAAVYPGITNYGKYCEKGQDAKDLTLSWSFTNRDDINYIKKILRTRIQSYDPKYWEMLNVNKSIINTICICSNGNPRFAFHIIDQLRVIVYFRKNYLYATSN